MALPGRVNNDSLYFHQYMAAVLDLVGAELPAALGPTDRDQYEREHALRAAVVTGVSQRESWPEELFATLIRAAVHDPNPSFNRQLIEPALAAVGRRKIQDALPELLSSGTNAEKAGAARAWYWTQVPLRFNSAENVQTRIPTPESQREYDAVDDLRTRWRQTALQEFVSNKDLDVRRCICRASPSTPPVTRPTSKTSSRQPCTSPGPTLMSTSGTESSTRSDRPRRFRFGSQPALRPLTASRHLYLVAAVSSWGSVRHEVARSE